MVAPPCPPAFPAACPAAGRRARPPNARSASRSGEVGERPMRDHVHAVGLHAQLQQPRAPVLGVHDHRVEALVQPPLGGQLTRPRLARQHVVGGQHELGARRVGLRICGPLPRKQMHIERLHRQPLEVHDVGRARGAPVAQHVRHVLCRASAPGRSASAGPRRRRGGRAGRRARAAHTPPARASPRRRSGS